MNFSGHALHSPWLGTGTLHALNVFATGYELEISMKVLYLGFGTRSSRVSVVSQNMLWNTSDVSQRSGSDAQRLVRLGPLSVTCMQ